MLVVLSEDDQLALGTPRAAWLAYAPLLTHQFGRRLLVARDDHFFTQGELVDQG
jgi:hypothetical protein